MSTFSIIAFPMFAVAIAIFSLYFRQKNKNYLWPGIALLTAGLVNAIIGISLG